MLCSMVLAVAMTAQAPAPTGPKTDAELRAITAKINAKYADPKYRARVKAQKDAERARLNEFMKKYEAQRPAREAAARERRARAAEAEAAAQKKAEADYRAMLPFMLEAQRQQMERMSQMERNAALHRMAAAAEYEAQTNKQRADTLQWYLMQQRRP
jgi:hypothetical protein